MSIKTTILIVLPLIILFVWFSGPLPPRTSTGWHDFNAWQTVLITAISGISLFSIFQRKKPKKDHTI